MAEQKKTTFRNTVADYAAYANISQNEAHDQLLTFMSFIVDMLTQGKEVNLHGFCKFYVRQRAGFLSRNPQTQEPVQVPAVCVPAIKFSSRAKDRVKEAQKPTID